MRTSTSQYQSSVAVAYLYFENYFRLNHRRSAVDEQNYLMNNNRLVKKRTQQKIERKHFGFQSMSPSSQVNGNIPRYHPHRSVEKYDCLSVHYVHLPIQCFLAFSTFWIRHVLVAYYTRHLFIRVRYISMLQVHDACLYTSFVFVCHKIVALVSHIRNDQNISVE